MQDLLRVGNHSVSAGTWPSADNVITPLFKIGQIDGEHCMKHIRLACLEAHLLSIRIVNNNKFYVVDVRFSFDPDNRGNLFIYKTYIFFPAHKLERACADGVAC